MTFRLYPKKHIDLDMDSPDAMGFCDRSGFAVNRQDLQKQMQYTASGNLIWTGLYVSEMFLDQPNPALVFAKNLTDPTPVMDPRPPQGQTLTANNNNLPVTNMIQFDAIQLSSEFNGVTAPPPNVRSEEAEDFNWFQQ